MTRASLNLSIVATVFLPLSFITGLLGMNVGGIPDEHNPLGFWLVTGLSIVISVLAWRWLRHKTYDRYLPQTSVGQIATERSMEPCSITDTGLTPAAKEVTEGPSKHIDTPSDTELTRQDQSAGTNVHKQRAFSRGKLVGVHVVALLLALLMFLFHVVIIIDVAGELIRREAWLLAHFGQYAGKIALLGCFFLLFLAHVLEAGAWGLYLRGARLLPSVTDGIYFTAVSITTLGYGDVLLKYPWRHLGTLIAITGVLMFGCSTAFLFLVLQVVWKLHI